MHLYVTVQDCWLATGRDSESYKVTSGGRNVTPMDINQAPKCQNLTNEQHLNVSPTREIMHEVGTTVRTS